MNTLAMAFGLAFGGVALSSLLLKAMGVPGEISATVSTVIMGFVPYIHKALEEAKGRRKSGDAPLFSMEGFGVPPQRMLVYASALIFGALQAGSAVGFYIMGLVSEELGYEQPIRLLSPHLFSFFFVTLPAVFLIGRWVGSRSVQASVTIVLAATFAARFVAALIDFVVLGDAEFQAAFGTEKTIVYFLGSLVLGFGFLSVPTLIGYWRGRVRRPFAYATYLLRSSKPEDQADIIALVYREARNRERPKPKPLLTNLKETLIPRDKGADTRLPRTPPPHSSDRRPSAMLLGIDGPVRGRHFEIDKDRVSIGAASHNDVSIDSDDFASSIHAHIEYDGGRLYLVDDGSRNGTYLNDVQLRAERKALKLGDRFRVGRSYFQLSSGAT